MTATCVVLDQEVTSRYAIYHADCVEVLRGIPTESLDFVIYSPPFASLYTYSNSERDMGNVRSEEEFGEHYGYLAKELYRCLKPGRLMSVHCMNLPTTKQRDNVIGLSDFRGDLIRIHCGSRDPMIESAIRLLCEATTQLGHIPTFDRQDGWFKEANRLITEYNIQKAEEGKFIYHSEVCIWKDPVTAMQRTKAIGLLHKQVVKDSCMSRQGIPDYLVTFRKPGVNPDPVEGPFTYFAGDYDLPPSEDDTRKSIEIWQRYASPVWMDINPSDTLQKESAREEADERHICPLQLQVIDRALQMWTNEGDTVLDPFAGIGSSGVVAIRRNRKFIGAELKASYFQQSRQNLRDAVIMSGQASLCFDE